VVARKALPSDQQLEDFSRYVEEMHAVLQLSVLFHKKESGDDGGQILVTNIRTHDNSTGSEVVNYTQKKRGEICSFIVATFFYERAQKAIKLLSWTHNSRN